MAAVHEFADCMVVMADHRTEAGFWRAGEPVIRLPLSASAEELGSAVHRALSEAPSVAPNVGWKEYSPMRAALARAAGFRSWSPFDRQGRMCSVRLMDTGSVIVMPTRHGGTRGDDKGFHELPDAQAILDSDPGPSLLGDAVRRALAASIAAGS